VNATILLHTAARRYCLERYDFWCNRYSEIVRQSGDRESDGYHYTAEALATFPRYNVLKAIRIDLERLTPDKLGDFESAKALLILAGLTAGDDFTRPTADQVEYPVSIEEREAFCRYISGLSLSDLRAVEALPFRRVLTADESKNLRSLMYHRWQIVDGYWYPLAECGLSDIVAFKEYAFSGTATQPLLQSILAGRGIARVWELREYGPEYEQDISLFEPHYNGAEGYWSSGNLDWIVYTSHESSVTVGGWLLGEIKAIWSSWQDHIWTGPYS